MNTKSEGKTQLTTKDVAGKCGVSKSTVLQWIKDGKLESMRLPSGHFRIHKDELQRYYDSLQYHPTRA